MLFTLIEEGVKPLYIPNEGWPWLYGIIYQNVRPEREHNTSPYKNISGSALYNNKCSEFKTFIKVQGKRIERWAKLLKGYKVL